MIQNIIETVLKVKDEASAGLAAFNASTKAVTENIQTLGIRAGAAGAAITGAFSLMTYSATSYGEELKKMSAMSGVSTEALSRLGYAASQNESSMEALNMAFKFLGKSMNTAITEGGEAGKAFGRLGISVQDTQGNMKSADAMFLEIVDAIKNVGSESEKTSIAMALFGRAGYQLKPLLAASSDEIRRLGQEAESLGIVLSTKQVAALDDLGDEISKIKQGYKGLASTIVLEMMPDIKALVAMIVETIKIFIEWSQQHKELVVLIARIVAGIGILLTVIGTLAGAVVALSTAWSTLVLAWTTIAAVLGPVGVALLGTVGQFAMVAAAIIGLLFVVYKFRDEIGTFFRGLLEDTQTVVQFLLEQMAAVASKLGIFGPLIAAALTSIKNAVPELKTMTLNAGASIANFGVGLINQLTSMAENAVGPLKGYLDRVVSAAKAATEQTNREEEKQEKQRITRWSRFKDGWNSAFKSAGDNFRELGAIAANVTDAIFANFGTAFAQMLMEGKSFTKQFAALFKSLAISVIADIAAMIMKMLVFRTIATLVGSPVFGFTPFAEGGRVTKPTLALIGEGGEPESIVPDSKAKKFAIDVLTKGSSDVSSKTSSSKAAPAEAKASGDMYNVNNYFTISGSEDPKKLADTIAEKIMYSVRARGQINFARG